MKSTNVFAKDLSVEPPSSPNKLVAGYAILARCLDKGRAELNNSAGEYHFGCPIDQMLLDFKGVKADDIKKLLSEGASNEAVADWLSTNGRNVTRAEIDAWSAKVAATRPFESEDAEKKEWFAGECKRLDLDPEETTLFDYLEEDDRRMALQTA